MSSVVLPFCQEFVRSFSPESHRSPIVQRYLHDLFSYPEFDLTEPELTLVLAARPQSEASLLQALGCNESTLDNNILAWLFSILRQGKTSPELDEPVFTFTDDEFHYFYHKIAATHIKPQIDSFVVRFLTSDLPFEEKCQSYHDTCSSLICEMCKLFPDFAKPMVTEYTETMLLSRLYPYISNTLQARSQVDLDFQHKLASLRNISLKDLQSTINPFSVDVQLRSGTCL